MGTSYPSSKGAQPPIFGPCLLWPNGWMDQHATWYGGRSRPRPYCVRWGPTPPGKGHSTPSFSAHVYFGQTVTHLSFCWAVVTHVVAACGTPVRGPLCQYNFVYTGNITQNMHVNYMHVWWHCTTGWLSYSATKPVYNFCVYLWLPYVIGQTIYIFILFLLSSSSFF